ncbi:hypothetical protein IQ241_08110 [Romeria aff. gracilis LEGE 07310]|uniref:DNA methylase adenine-specific domain-containing protein n=1 Tax=Vasconcelosia minhoensis LEGE 07310 TaxID=915328 RepID=A0A8J7DC40_9CYAN|nr:hypothetical protein [Romeria gracilis]MBE9077258.1 hypothetical protein [Romeria aff. gracilis LEGE 07310]
MGYDWPLAQKYLRSRRLDVLFSQVLGWAQPPSQRWRKHSPSIRYRSLASRAGATVWQVEVKDSLSAAVQRQVYETLASAQSLLIFTHPEHYRSLWYWQIFEQPHSLLYVPGQPADLWQPRLEQLTTAESLTLAVETAPRYAEFKLHLQAFSEGTSGMSNEADRQGYAAVLLKRLIFVQILQRQGLLDRDRWYLQNKLGQIQQRGTDRFFIDGWQKLLRQGFSLPPPERPPVFRAALGEVPYLGHLFGPHRLERQYPEIAVCDRPFEAALVWLSGDGAAPLLNPWGSPALGQVLAWHWAEKTDGVATLTEQAELGCDRVLTPWLLQQLGLPSTADLNGQLFDGDAGLCRRLIQEILPLLRALDPACGSGMFLLALHQRLTELYCALIGCIHETQDSQLLIWLKGLQAEHPELIQAIQRRVLRQNLYGVDLRAEAVETAQLQLLARLVATARSPQSVEPLPSLDFNILIGNSLVGLIRVDPAGFDRIVGSGTALQGNLLQPLAADSYRAILAEKNISLEHYQGQTRLLVELHEIPQYAQLEFLRDHISRLDRTAQDKLNQLLLNQFSQTLGIQYRETQLTDRPQRRLLTQEDLEIFYPLHWGYHFHQILEQHGGFDIILSALPNDRVKPTTEEFFQHFRDLGQDKGLSPESFKTSKQALLRADPELSQAWLFYQSQFSFITDYFYRAEQYAHQSPEVNGRRVRNQLRLDWLLVEQTFNLLRPGGRSGLWGADALQAHEKAETLRSHLAAHTQDLQYLIWGPSKDPLALCLLSFSKI